MSTDTNPSDLDSEEMPAEPTMSATDESNASNEEAGADVASPEFQPVTDSSTPNQQAGDLNRFQEIKVTVSADLGRAEIPIQTLMNLGEGSVLELNRSIDSPVELVAQGVALACGEVVVVDGCFAIRITEVYQNQK